jgi:hypothetical protein
MCPCHPEVKRVVHEEIGQDWANHSPYTKGNLGRPSGLAVGNRLGAGQAGLECYGEW